MQDENAAKILGYSGLIPFFSLALLAGIADAKTSALAASALLLYAAIILSFMGGVVWGRAIAGMRDGGLAVSLVIAVLPALLAWVGAWLGGKPGVLLCCLGLVALWVHDHRTQAIPEWFRRLRAHLTVGAVLSTASLLLP